MPEPIAIDLPPHTSPSPGKGWRWVSPLRAGVVLLVVAAVVVAWFLTRGSAPSYRTAEVRVGTVESTLDSVGTIAPVNQADLAFDVSGTVGSVDVSVGSAVTAGQTVASLDPTALDASVVSAQATLAADQATLAGAEASEAAGATTPAAGATTPAAGSQTAPGAADSSRPGQSGAGSQEIAQLQATLVTDQSQEDADAAAATRALAAATGLCGGTAPSASAAGGTGTGSSPTGAASSSAASTGTTPSGGTGTTTTTGSGGGAVCAGALTQATAAQSKVSADIKEVDQAESDLAAVLDPALATTPAATATATATALAGGTAPRATTAAFSSSGSTTAATGTAQPGGSSGGRTATPTPQQLAVDQAAIDVAQAQLNDAQQALAGVNLVSTIGGTVASVSVVPGESVSASSGAAHPEIVVIGPGASYQVVTQVPVADIGKVGIGQPARVVPDATNAELSGAVTSIGVLPTNSSTTTSYPVTISLASADLGLFSGASVAATIVTGEATGVTAVPTSAVRTIGSTHVVTVVSGGTATQTRVTLGTTGDVLTQVTSGVRPGEVVALADLGAPVPTASTPVTRFGGGFGGGLGGGGFGRAGLGGGLGGTFG